MIKKIVILALAVFMLAVPVVGANDGGSYTDYGQRLHITFEAKSKTAEIGESFEVTVNMTNVTNEDIEIRSCTEIFESDSEYSGVNFDDFIIEPYKSVQMDIVCILPKSINWYKKDGKYYADLNPVLLYEAIYTLPQDQGEEYDDETWEYYSENYNPVPIEITNLYDGSEYMDIQVCSASDSLTFFDYNNTTQVYDHNIVRGKYQTEYYNEVTYENLTHFTIEDIHLNYPSFSNDYENISIGSLEVVTVQRDRYTFIAPRKIDNPYSLDYRATFKIDDKYYGVMASAVYETFIYTRPSVEIKTVVNKDAEHDGLEYTCVVTNNNEHDIENLTVVYSYNHPGFTDFYNKDYIEGTLHANESWDIPITFDEEKGAYIATGYLRGNLYYYWFYSSYYEDEIWSEYPYGYSTMDLSNIWGDEEDESEVDEEAEEEVKEEPIESVEKVQMKNYIVPAWVWIVLCAAVIMIGISHYIERIREKQKDTEDKYD